MNIHLLLKISIINIFQTLNKRKFIFQVKKDSSSPKLVELYILGIS
jgi:hypothetical protein